jgi:hypothetical protein
VGWKRGTHFQSAAEAKNTELEQNARVTLALDDTKQGEDVVIVEGMAEVLDDPDISATLPTYVEKYGAMMQGMDVTPESMAADFSVGIRITPRNSGVGLNRLSSFNWCVEPDSRTPTRGVPTCPKVT